MHQEEMTAVDIKNQMSEQDWNRIYNMTQDVNLYDNLIKSLFATIYGNDEIKRGILLMLFGGVPKKTVEHTTLRGDTNVCIVGDPSTAKSQFLKQVISATLFFLLTLIVIIISFTYRSPNLPLVQFTLLVKDPVQLV